MLRFLQQLVGSKPSPPSRRRPAIRHSRLRGEGLENRSLMAVFAGELHINSTTSNAQLGADTASQPASFGRTVTAWIHEYSSSDYDIRAQIYDHKGNKIGGEIAVAQSPRIEGDPSVAVDGRGNFVIAWTDETTPGNNDVKARRYNTNGAPLTGVVSVASTASYESEPSVATDDNGNFVVGYTTEYTATDFDVRVRRYNSSGAFLGTVEVATSGSNEYDSSVAMTANGRFAVAYQMDVPKSGGGVDNDIRLHRYNANGAYLSTAYIGNSTRNERNPDVAMDRDGNAVVAYEYEYSTGDWDIRARKVSQAGAMGAAMPIANSSKIEQSPSVAMDHTAGDGDFVVAYAMPQTGGFSIFPPQRIFVKEVSATGAVRAVHDLGLQSAFAAPSIAINGSDTWFATYDSGERTNDRFGGIFGRRGSLA